MVLAANTFYGKSSVELASGQVIHFGTDWIQEAYLTLAPLLGTAAASILFAVALLASGQSSTVTGTLAGQVVMEGFLHLRIRPWVRRLITRLAAILPAVLVIGIRGDDSVNDLLTLSQVVLGIQLPLAMIPLLWFTQLEEADGRLRQWALPAGSRLGVVPAHHGVGYLWAGGYPHPCRAWLNGAGRRSIGGYMYRKILVTLDTTSADRTILEHIRPLARLCQSKIVLMHVADGWAARIHGEDAVSPEITEDQAYLDKVQRELRAEGLDVEAVLAYGDPSREIVRWVRQERCDLIAMSTPRPPLPGRPVPGLAGRPRETPRGCAGAAVEGEGFVGAVSLELRRCLLVDQRPDLPAGFQAFHIRILPPPGQWPATASARASLRNWRPSQRTAG